MSDTNNIPARPREIERDARALQKFSGMKYTQALRAVEHPLAQGILGERICTRDIIRVLTAHPALSTDAAGADERITHLGRNGLRSADQSPLELSSEHDYLSVVLAAEVLRAFSATDAPNSDAGSYGLKHTVEEFLGEYLPDFSYVSNGTTIWAAAAVGIPVRGHTTDTDDPNANFGLPSDQVNYARRMRRSSGGQRDSIRAHHHRPPGYTFLQGALTEWRDSRTAPGRWDGVDENAAPRTSPFHKWLVAQAGPGDMGSRARLADDYAAGFRDGDHGVAQQPEHLIGILRALNADEAFLDAAREAIVDWARTSPDSTGIRTELISSSRDDHDGWGAGSGDTERYTYRCPCGRDTIIEEHENTSGFREHDHWFGCDICRQEWQFVDGLPTREWRIEPRRAVALSI
ncbi:hypothetical protein JOE58_002603 [Curtobacterium luteum]|uniref:Uncharacterized protein n=1 Tax=Curtobacterium luteum TaxID=33881 RepID=A0A8H9GBQ9_9MICO|nr:hypothetical protein [Curtobacterium luteum]MBM7803352.1 hypothetical protein [Curtobacterium luteum]GGL07866.1 hypothetical protein GCM10009769_27580 [Curtobacterium luteum]